MAAEISTPFKSSLLEETNPPARWLIAREELIIPTASAVTAVTRNRKRCGPRHGVFLSLCHHPVKTKMGTIRRSQFCESEGNLPLRHSLAGVGRLC